MEKSAEAKGLKFNVAIEPSVRLAVRGDPTRLRQVLTNLASNAIEAMDAIKDIRRVLQARTERHDGRYEIVVAV